MPGVGAFRAFLCGGSAMQGLGTLGGAGSWASGINGAGQVVVRSGWPEAPCRRRTCTDTPTGDCCMRAIGVDAVLAAVGARAGRASLSPG